MRETKKTGAPAKACFVTCPECDANFRLKPGEPLPPHTFLSKPCTPATKG